MINLPPPPTSPKKPYGVDSAQQEETRPAAEKKTRTPSQEIIFNAKTSNDSPKEMKATVSKGGIFGFFSRLFASLFGRKKTESPFSQSVASPMKFSADPNEKPQHPSPLPAAQRPLAPPPPAARSPAAQRPPAPPPPRARPPADIPLSQAASAAPQPGLSAQPRRPPPPLPPQRNPVSPAPNNPPAAMLSQPAPSQIPEEFREKLTEYQAAIESGDLGAIAQAAGVLTEMIKACLDPSTKEAMIAERQRIAKETQVPIMVGGRKLELTVEAGNIESIERGITVLHDHFVPKMMNCTNPQEMRQLMNDAHTLYKNLRMTINDMPSDPQAAFNAQLTNALAPQTLRSGRKEYQIRAITVALKSTRKAERLPASTDPQLVLSAIKYQTVADMIRIGSRPSGQAKDDAGFAGQLLRDASNDSNFGARVKGDPSIQIMNGIVKSWPLVGPETEGLSREDLQKITKDQNMAIRDFYGGAVKIERYLQLMSGIMPLLEEHKVLPEGQLMAFRQLIAAHEDISRIRQRFEGCLTDEARGQLAELNQRMAAETEGVLRGRLQEQATGVFLQGLDQEKVLALLADLSIAADLGRVAAFFTQAPQIQGEITKLANQENQRSAAKKPHPFAMTPEELEKPEAVQQKALVESARKQAIGANSVLYLTNTLITQTNTDFVGGFILAMQALLKSMPEDHPQKEQILANFQRIQQSLQ